MAFVLVSISFSHQNHKLPRTLPKICTEILIGFDLFQGFYVGLAIFVNSKPMRFTLVSIWIFHKTLVTCAASKYIACIAKIHATYTTCTTYVHTKNSCLCNEVLINNSFPQAQIDIVTGANAHCQLCPFVISRNESISQQITIFENSVCQPIGITANTTDNFKIIEI